MTTARPDLAIVTWNMHVGAGNLERLVDDLSAGRLTTAPPANYVLLLQEVIAGGSHDPAALARRRQLSFTFQPVRMRGPRITGNAIVSTLPLRDVRQIDLPRERQPRGAIVATISIGGRDLFVADTQLENRVSVTRGLLFSDGPRGRQAQALLDALPAGHGIAGGDLNTWLGPDEPAWRAFAGRFPDTPTDRLQPSVRNRLVLDHLFFDVPDEWTVARHTVSDSYGSDHRPVIGTISGVS